MCHSEFPYARDYESQSLTQAGTSRQLGISTGAHVTVVAMPICGCCGMVILRILDS